MVSIYNVKNPTKRKIPKLRVPRSQHYTLMFPTDLKTGKDCSQYNKLRGIAYTNFWDSFLEDCVKRMSKHERATELYEAGEFDIMTGCLN